jgi:hypothetical protein
VREGRRAEVRAAAEQVGDPLVPQGGVPDPVRDGPQDVGPGRPGGRRDLAVHRVDHQFEQFFLGVDVPVEPHRAGVERAGDLPQ